MDLYVVHNFFLSSPPLLIDSLASSIYHKFSTRTIVVRFSVFDRPPTHLSKAQSGDCHVDLSSAPTVVPLIFGGYFHCSIIVRKCLRHAVKQMDRQLGTVLSKRAVMTVAHRKTSPTSLNKILSFALHGIHVGLQFHAHEPVL